MHTSPFLRSLQGRDAFFRFADEKAELLGGQEALVPLLVRTNLGWCSFHCTMFLFGIILSQITISI